MMLSVYAIKNLLVLMKIGTSLMYARGDMLGSQAVHARSCSHSSNSQVNI